MTTYENHTKSTAHAWPRPRLFLKLAIPVLILVLALSACTGLETPEDAVILYLSSAGLGEEQAAMQLWELSEVGTSLVDLDPQQDTVRMDNRRTLAAELTQAIRMSGSRLTWNQELTAEYYDIRDDTVLVTESLNEADLATITISLTLEREDVDPLEESLSFNLWKNGEMGWRITGLDKGITVLRPFLDQVKAAQ